MRAAFRTHISCENEPKKLRSARRAVRPHAAGRNDDGEEELRMARGHLEKQQRQHRFANANPQEAERAAWASLCQMLFASNEFLYLD